MGNVNSVVLELLHLKHTHVHVVASVPPTTILLSFPASECAGKFGFCFFFTFFFCKRTHLLYQHGGPGWECSRERVVNVFISPLYRENLSEKHVLLLTRQDVLSSATHTFLSVNPSHTQTHTHTDKISFSRGSMPSTEKKNPNQQDLLGS